MVEERKKEIPAGSRNDIKLFQSSDLFGKEKLIVIEHRGTLYRLMITRQDKLILTK